MSVTAWIFFSSYLFPVKSFSLSFKSETRSDVSLFASVFLFCTQQKSNKRKHFRTWNFSNFFLFMTVLRPIISHPKIFRRGCPVQSTFYWIEGSSQLRSRKDFCVYMARIIAPVGTAFHYVLPLPSIKSTKKDRWIITFNTFSTKIEINVDCRCITPIFFLQLGTTADHRDRLLPGDRPNPSDDCCMTKELDAFFDCSSYQ